MTTVLPRTDVVVVGLGAAGGVAVLPLVRAGLEVVGVEAGSWLSTRDMAPDELQLIRRTWPPGRQKTRGEIPTSRADATRQATRAAPPTMMNAVGGTSNHYMGQSWRLNPWDFGVVSETVRRYGASRIPAACTVEDWPFGYGELEPYYDIVEREVGVSGQAGNIEGRVDERGNVFEGPRRRGYPMPPLRGSGYTDMMAAAARALGWHPFPGPAAITSQVYEGRPACGYHGFCLGGGCHINAKSSTAASTIPKALASGQLEIVTEAHVTTVDVDRDGRATGVRYVCDGTEYVQPADAVLLAGYTYENVRMLLLSRSPAFPHGLANNAGQVGQHYFSHNQYAQVVARFPFDLNTWYGTPSQGIAVDDWADDNFDHGDVDFIGGGNLWVYTEKRPIASVGMSTWDDAPTWGSAWKAAVIAGAKGVDSAYIQKSTFPYEGNRLDLDPQVTDALGLPVCRITARWRENDIRLTRFVQDRMIEWYTEAGAVATRRNPLGEEMGLSTHAYGGTRMGDNPETSVVDRWGFAHEVPNLGILGASVMGTSGAHNPTLTLQALAWRTAEYLARNRGSITGV